MRAGQLRHLLTLQSETRASDGAGGGTLTWANVATVYASIEPLSGAELFQAQQINPKVSHAIKIRYYPGVVSKMRALYGVRIFNVHSVLNLDERNRELRLVCEEVAT